MKTHIIFVFALILLILALSFVYAEDCVQEVMPNSNGCDIKEIFPKDCNDFGYRDSSPNCKPDGICKCQPVIDESIPKEMRLKQCIGKELIGTNDCSRLTKEELETNGTSCEDYYELLWYEGKGKQCITKDENATYPCSTGKECAALSCYYEPQETAKKCNESNKNKIDVNLYLDPIYIEKTKEERLFRPSEITPFDDIICEANLTILAGEKIPYVIDGKLLTYDNGEVEIKSPMWLSCQDCPNAEYISENKTFTYQRKIEGWPGGWTEDKDVMGSIIKSRLVRCEVEYNSKKGYVVSSVGLCVHLWGKDDGISIVNMGGQREGRGPKLIVDIAMNNYQSGFNVIDPFKTYKEKFSHYADLKEYDETNWKHNLNDRDANSFKDEYFNIVPSISECKNENFYLFYTSSIKGAYTQIGSKTLFSRDITPAVAIHEFGHAFCKIYDEYVYNSTYMTIIPYLIKVKLTRKAGLNCQKNPDKFLPYSTTAFEGCTSLKYYRSTFKSIMNGKEFFDTRFNVISCGYCVKEINGQSMVSNWDKCINLDTIKS